MGRRHSSVDSSLPTILRSWVQIPSLPSTLLPFYSKILLWLSLSWEKDDNKPKKRGRIWAILKCKIGVYVKTEALNSEHSPLLGEDSLRNWSPVLQVCIELISSFTSLHWTDSLLPNTPSYTDKIFSQFFMPVLVANQKYDWCQFHWLGGYLDVAMAVFFTKLT